MLSLTYITKALLEYGLNINRTFLMCGFKEKFFLMLNSINFGCLTGLFSSLIRISFSGNC